MKKTLSQVVLCMVLTFGLLVTSVWAVRITAVVSLPGVNAAGALDIGLGAGVTCNYNVNTKTGKFRGKGNGQVQNLSGQTQQFDNPPIFESVVTSNRYTVKTNGSCKVTFSGAFPVP